MSKKQKPLDQQVIVITGASSGIGRATAEMAAEKGARVVLGARSEDALKKIVDGVKAKGGKASYVVMDVGKEEDVKRLSDKAVEEHGRYDTWVNNAGVSIYGLLEEVTTEDSRQLFDTNYWGTVYGSLEAAKHFKTRQDALGTIINVGSTLSDRAIPIQGMYSASKHAVKGFTDALRMELEHEGAFVWVSLIKPAALDTNYAEHAKNYMDKKPALPSPAYHPNIAAEAILHCATHKQRDMFVGGAGGKGIAAFGKNAPRLADKYMEAVIIDQQKGDAPARRGGDGLHSASGGGAVRGYSRGGVRQTSLYTQAQTRPGTSGTVAGLLLSVGAGLLAWRVLAQGSRDGGRRYVGGSRPSYSSYPREDFSREDFEARLNPRTPGRLILPEGMSGR